MYKRVELDSRDKITHKNIYNVALKMLVYLCNKGKDYQEKNIKVSKIVSVKGMFPIASQKGSM